MTRAREAQVPGSAIFGRRLPPAGGFALILLVALGGVAACGSGSSASSASSGDPDFANRVYSEVPGLPLTVELTDGRWTGAPYQPGGASRPSLTLLPGFVVRGDLGADGRADAVAVLALAGGGSGEFLHAVVVSRAGTAWAQTALVPLGDRVQLRGGRIEDGVLLLDLVEAGAEDAACCPGRVVTRGWRYGPDGELEAFDAGLAESRLAWSLLEGTSWTLRSWGHGQPVPVPGAVTLEAGPGTARGSSGCNQYAGRVEDGSFPGELAVADLAVTRMACADPLMATERRFLEQLGAVGKFAFFGGRLALSYRNGEEGWDRMVFEPLEKSPAAQ